MASDEIEPYRDGQSMDLDLDDQQAALKFAAIVNLERYRERIQETFDVADVALELIPDAPAYRKIINALATNELLRAMEGQYTAKELKASADAVETWIKIGRDFEIDSINRSLDKLPAEERQALLTKLADQAKDAVAKKKPRKH